jgi:transcription initiation factor TFIID subunit TAF12
LLELADEFVETVAAGAALLAKHRGSNVVEAADLNLHLGKLTSLLSLRVTTPLPL